MSPIGIARVVFAVAVAAALTMQTDQTASSWRFAVGRSSESLHAAARDMPGAGIEVTLPHRALHPNAAMWYARRLDLPANASIAVEADDGAQLFVDGVQWAQERRVFFPPAPVGAGSHAIIVRVLNNAMQGGLRRVTVLDRRPHYPEPSLPRPAAGFDAVESAAFRSRMPAGGAPCDFTLWADSQSGWGTFATIVARMAERPHHFSAGIGDLVSDGSDPAAWTRLVETLAPLAARVPIVPIVGNHDYDGFYNDLMSRWYGQLFEREATWMAWSCGPARFAAIDLNREFPIGISPNSAQYAWLEQEVRSRAWRDAKWRVLLVHQPPYSRSWAGYDGDEAMRTIVRELVAQHGLQLVVSGHSHAYEHLVRDISGRPLHVLITGGAGGGLEEPVSPAVREPDRVILAHHFIRGRADRTALAIEAIDRHGQVLDRWALR
jgi:Calcineurin-like phosphoesterase